MAYIDVSYCSKYDQAVSAAGSEFRSDRLWTDFIEWEIATKNLQRAMALYDRLLVTPTQMYSSHFDKSVAMRYP